MSTTPLGAADAARPSSADDRPPRVRHQAREALGLMTFSAAASLALALALLLLSHLGR